MNRKASTEPFFSEPLPDAPWPVEARSLLTNREQSFYQRLSNVYPHHKILVQVALSQLVEVDRHHPQRQSIRGRYKQLVADFVLCKPDLSIVAVIELDDRSHERAHRQGADARKAKALADAGIRLVRIPAGGLPSENTLRGLIEGSERGNPVHPAETEMRLAETVDTYEESAPVAWKEGQATAESRMWRNRALKIALAGLLVGVWFIYSQYVPTVFKTLAPFPARQVVSPVIPKAAAAVKPAAGVAAPTSRPEMADAKILQKQKDLAWAAFYSAPASCEHPADWNAQVGCGNQYMRAKKRFEAQWEAEHESGQATQAAVVLSNESLSRAHP